MRSEFDFGLFLIDKNMGESRLRLYTIWMRMKDRCYKEKCNVYKYYGGKGVAICEGWRNDFKAFKEWALSHGYNDNLSIDRIDGGKNYEPSNCRWATRMEQQSNLGWNKRYELFGEMLTAPEIARRYNLPTSIMYGRLFKGRSAEVAISMPYRAVHRKQL